MARLRMQMGAIRKDGKWTGEWSSGTVEEHVSPTLQSLRSPTRYHVVSDAQLARDLKGRTLADVYRDNKVGRGDPPMKYVPKFETTVYKDKVLTPTCAGGLFAVHTPRGTIAGEYRKHCEDRGHTPHPASLDRTHPINAHIEKAPKVERVNA